MKLPAYTLAINDAYISKFKYNINVLSSGAYDTVIRNYNGKLYKLLQNHKTTLSVCNKVQRAVRSRLLFKKLCDFVT